MERIMSQEERIRRAEETYYRRCQNRNVYYYPNYKDNTKNTEKNGKIKIIAKLTAQIIICLIIYITAYIIQNSDAEFSKTVINGLKQFVSQDAKVQDIQNKMNYIGETIYSFFNENTTNKNTILENEIVNTIQENTTLENGVTNTEQENSVLENEATNTLQENLINNVTQDANANTSQYEGLAIGGAEENEEVQNKSQEELDIEYIKTNYNIIWPLEGTITSTYGPRTPTEIVTANHKGLDIGGDIGTEIKAAMSGIVTLVSYEGDYGNHIQIENQDVTTLYAHCSILCVEEGQQITQGEKIAEVGDTGRVTGPHLHFEIRREGRTIDPQEILS